MGGEKGGDGDEKPRREAGSQPGGGEWGWLLGEDSNL